MIKNIFCFDIVNTYPYKNLAVEEYLTFHVPEDTIILFLWQNRRSVVIGKNQNPWRECDVSRLEEDDGFLVRRLSGGGAVFHDLGNLNFTFCVRREDYDVDRQLSVILGAVRSLGIDAEKTGRNDITVDGRKFSGNAFYRSGDFCYHHGTLMVDTDGSEMSKYLSPAPDKLRSKGVSSVKSRVANLIEFCPELTVELLKSELIRSLGEVYGGKVGFISENELPSEDIDRLTTKFSSDKWKYGRRIPFEYQIERRFAWGGINIQLHVDEGKVIDAVIYSDAMDQEAISAAAAALEGCAFEKTALADAVRSAGRKDSDIAEDLAALIYESI